MQIGAFKGTIRQRPSTEATPGTRKGNACMKGEFVYVNSAIFAGGACTQGWSVRLRAFLARNSSRLPSHHVELCRYSERGLQGLERQALTRSA